MRRFEMFEAQSVAEACAALTEFGEGARVYAGGTELLLVLKEGFLEADVLVNIKTIPGLNDIRMGEGMVHIGSLATHRQLELSDVVREQLPTFAEAERHVANVRVRNVGTLGGNLCFGEPHSDPGAVLLLHDAMVEVASVDGTRTLPLSEFIVGPFEVALEPGEILTEIQVPVLPEGTVSSYRKFGFLERPSVGVGVALTPDADRAGVVEARISVGSAGPIPTRVPEAEALLQGVALVDVAQLAAQVGDAAAKAMDTSSDLHGSADYKRHLVAVMVRQAIEAAAQELQGVRNGAQ